MRSIPILNNIALKYIKIYFNMYNLKAETKLKIDYSTKIMRLLSTRKVWISKTELKHNNDKVIINLYIYDRPNNIILNKLNKLLKNNKLNIINKNRSLINLGTKFINNLTNMEIKPFNSKFINLITLVINKIKKIILTKDILTYETEIFYYKKYL